MKRLLRKWADRLRIKSTQFIITVSFAFTVLAMLAVGIILYEKFAETAKTNAVLTNQQLIEQVNYNIESYLRGMRQTFELADYNIRKASDIPEEVLKGQLDTLISSREDIVSLALFSAEGELIVSNPKGAMRKLTNLKKQNWFTDAVANPDELHFSPPHIQNLFKGQYRWVVSISRGITFSRENRIVRGVLVMDVNFHTIESLCQRVSLGKEGYVFIADSVGNIVYHPQQQLIYLDLKRENLALALRYSFGTYFDEWNGKERMLTVQNVNPVGWNIVGVSYMQEYLTTKNEVSAWIFGLIGLVVAVIISVSIFMSIKISAPIKRLKQSMSRVEYGDLSVSLSVNGDGELQQLAMRFNSMVARIGDLMNQVKTEQEAKRKSELEVLQAQINPHFLYNTLNSVVRMVGIGKTEEITTTITSLSKYFRISLSKGQSIVTVQDELEHVRNYLIIQNIRFKNKFRYEIDAPEPVLSCLTLKLILQPIVENAIQHGIEPMVDEGIISIGVVNQDNDKLIFRVKDNGVGMPPHIVQGIKEGRVSSKQGSGVGMLNVHERIRLQFGGDFGLDIQSELEEGTTVTLTLPMMEGKGDRT